MEIARLQIAVDSTGAKSAQKDLQGLSAAAEKTESNVSSLIAAASGLAIFGTAASALRSAINASRDFNQAVSQLSAITGATGASLEYFSEQAQEIGRTTTLSASQAVDAFKLIASAKPDLLGNSEALAAVTREAVALSEAAIMDLPAAADALGTSLNQFGASADQAARFINVLAAGAQAGASEITDTAMALKNSGAAANAAGVSFEGANAAIQALAAGGIKGAEAGTSLRNVILELESGANQKLRPSVVGLTAALEGLAAENKSITALTEQFGKENVVAAATLVKQAETIGELEKAITGTNTAYEQAQKNNDNLAGDQLALASATEALAIAFGHKLDPAVRSSTQTMTTAVNGLNGSLDVITTSITILSALIAGKFVGSLAASGIALAQQTIAATKASVAVDMHGMVIARTTVASNAAALASRGLASAMAFMGGPVGLAVSGISLLVMGITEYQSRSISAQTDTQNLANTISVLATAAERAQDRFKRLLEGADALSKKEMAGRLVELEAALKKVEAQGKSFTRMFEKGTGSQAMIDGNVAAAKVLTDEIAVIRAKLGAQQVEQNDGAQKYTSRLQEQVNMLGAVTEREKILAQVRTGMLKVTPEEQERMLMLADQIDKQNALTMAVKATSAAKKEDAKAEKAATTELLKAQADAVKQAEASQAFRDQQQQRLGSADPMVGAQQAHAKELEELRLLNAAKLIEDSRYLDLKGQAERAHAEQMMILQEENFRAQSYGNELLMASLDQLQQGATDAFVGILTGASNGQEAVQQLASAILNEAVGALVEMGIAQVKSIIMGQTAQTAATATSVAAGAATAAAWTPAAAAASIASFGGAAASGLASMASAIPAMIGLLSFEGGGFTGTGSRSGGMDGKGGFMAMVHPNETIIDHTKGQSAGGSGVTVNVIQSSEKAGTQETKQNADGSQSVDVFVSDIYGDGPRARALQNAFGLKRNGK